MPERFYVPALGPDDRVILTGDEAHHLARVRRIRRGEQVVLFDGSGVECCAIVREIGRDGITLSIEARSQVNRELPFQLTLACSPAKGDRLRWLVEKATELGVSRFMPILTERSSEQARGVRADKMTRWVIEASKQCGRNVVMEVSDPMSWYPFLDWASADCLRLVADPTGTSLGSVFPLRCDGGVILAVGPEGGFTAEELRAAESLDWISVSLGPRILRVETAVVTFVARVVADR